MKKWIILLLVVCVVFFVAGCAAGPNPMVEKPAEVEKSAGFFHGLWHGFISFFTFIISLFTDRVNVYEVHNRGGWYDFGFILGIMIFYGGGSNAGKRAAKKS